MNRFSSNRFAISLFGESHGQVIGVTIDGVRAGVPLSEEDFTADLDRRRTGDEGSSPRRESDTPHIISGIFEGHTTGAPLTIVFNNENKISADYSTLVNHPRPSHADRTAGIKYGGMNDPRGGGHFSGRMTLGIVAAGVVAKKMLGSGITFSTHIAEVGGCKDPAEIASIIKEAQAAGDSVGGIVECVVSGVEAGIGEPFFDSVESVAAHLLFSIPAVKGVEFGAGFEAARRKGSQNNDLIIAPEGKTATNNDGGINGGITNGNPIMVRVAIKPTPSISLPQQTLNTANGQVEQLIIRGRHDSCIALRAGVVVEAAMAITLATLVDKQ